jgi:hypothetical protein
MPTLFSPELQTDNPVTITPNIDIGDINTSNTIQGLGKISSSAVTQAYDVSWPAQQGAVSYNVYGSMSPLGISNLLASGLTETNYVFNVPFFSETVEFYFWVASVDSKGVATLLSSDPCTLISAAMASVINPVTGDPDYMPDPAGINAETLKNYAYIRKGHRFLIENDGEPAWLYLKRGAEDKPWGAACTCTDMNDDDDDQDLQGRDRCKLCFGTGMYGGYYPKISTKIIYQGDVEKTFRFQKGGRLVEQTFNTLMLWSPTVRVGDLIIRAQTGERFRVSKRSESSKRGIRFKQEINLEQISQTDILMELTDAAIADALTTSKFPGFLRSGYKIFG